MRDFFGAFVVAFSMYSALPMPKINWTEKNMKYALCFFPLIGVVIGAALILWHYVCMRLGFDAFLFAAVATCIPVFITGGIHLDGFCDTSDALSSNQDKERKLEILKDPNCGAFALIKTCVYFILMFGFFTELDTTGLFALAICFVLSRALSGLAIVRFPKAKGSGLAALFSQNAHKNTVTVVMACYILACAILLFVVDVFAVLLLAVAVLVFIYYYCVAKKQFGGTTGDLAGWFLKLCELWVLIAIVMQRGII